MTERAVLTQILFLHPDRLTILELSLQVEGGGESFAKKDAVERAVREARIVTGDLGFLHDVGGLAAVRGVSTPVRIVVVDNDGGGLRLPLGGPGWPFRRSQGV